MQAFRNILVPTDFGAASEQAMTWAIELAQKYQSKLHLVHVFEIPMFAYGEGVYWPMEDFARDAQKTLDAAVEKTKARFPSTEGVLATGQAWERILGVAKERGADLIVMGTHGRRGLSHFFPVCACKLRSKLSAHLCGVGEA